MLFDRYFSKSFMVPSKALQRVLRDRSAEPPAALGRVSQGNA